MKRTRRQRWVAGDVLSWVLGVTLGLILGIALLIVAPRLGQAQGEANAGEEGTIIAQGENQTGADATGSESEDVASSEGTSEGQAGSAGSTQEGEAAAERQGGQSAGMGTNSGDEAEEGVTSTEQGAQAEADTAAGETSTNEANTDAVSTTDQTGAGATVAPLGTAEADEARATGEIGSSTAQNTGEGNTAEEAVTGQPTDSAGDTGAGQTIFASNCAGCHGANGQGGFGPSLVTADGPKSWTLAQFTTTLREGKTPERELAPTMPRYSEAQISDAQIVDLHAYIKTLN
ncbi:c-type cytochrome [Deinococcus sp. SDU3-2]|uniref:C-type cytochrome n=1 Tax=Deinococcus terrestris TaxID=2651870 RepID=A0A7X1NYM2_9DEIO|nr:cytochrome c [Deinococcus terrestris]MPY68207.1 c-type cytochrome [Deinococcus terrestris]